MRFVFYTQSIISDWNHGNAHFLRGVMRELETLGHDTVAYEPEDGWSRRNLMKSQGPHALRRFDTDFPGLASLAYGPDFDHESVLADADVVVVHEWTAPDLVAKIGHARRAGGGFLLLFHDTHHRAVSADADIAALPLDDYDIVLAFGSALRERYLRAGWGRQVVIWHEAADTHLFRPLPGLPPDGDLVWIGNWGDGERSEELSQFLIEPVRRLGLKSSVYGVRYPEAAVGALKDAGIRYLGWLANADVPSVFARHRLTVHVPRRPYVSALPGIPTIRVFEALACGIPLVSAPWNDIEGLFRVGEDFLVVRNSGEMTDALRTVLADHDEAAAIAASGLETIRKHHTCRHRALELLDIVAEHRPSPVFAAATVGEAIP